MTHYIFRLVLGIIFLVCAAVTAVRGDVLFTILYIALGAVFVWSAWRLRGDHDGR